MSSLALSEIHYQVDEENYEKDFDPMRQKTKSESSYTIEVTQDFKQWSEIGKVEGTGTSVKFTDLRDALFQKQYYRVKKDE